MKRKILSLALALMMIISVAAAMPVSATTTDKPINVDLGTADWNDLTPSSGYEWPEANIEATSKPEDATWITQGAYRFFRDVSNKLSNTYNVDKAGYYDVAIAYGGCVNSMVTISVDTYTTTGKIFATGEDYNESPKVVDVYNIRSIYLPEGPITLNLTVKPDAYSAVSNATPAYIYNIKLEYSNFQGERIDLEPRDATRSNTSYIYINSDGKLASYDTSFGDGEGDPSRFYGSSTELKMTFSNVAAPKAGNYDLWVAYGVNTTNAITLKGTVNNNVVSQSISSTGSSNTVVGVKLGTVYLNEADNTVIISRTGHTTYNDTLWIWDIRLAWSETQPAAMHTITAGPDPTEGGIVTPTTATVEEGESVTLTATPNSGYEFIGWFDENDNPACQTEVFEVRDVKADAAYTAKFAVDPSIIIDATNTTSTLGTGRLWLRSATVNNVSWVDATGVGYFEGGWNTEDIPVVVPTPITTAGYYDVTLSYASRYDGGKIIVYFEGQSVDLQAALPATSTAEANYVAEELSLGKVYLDTTTANVIVRAYAPADPNAEYGTPVHFYGLKLRPTEVNPTSVLINGALPTEHNGTELSYNTYAPATSDVAWANQGAIRIPGSDNWAKYTAYIPETGYYTVSIATGTTAGGVAIVGLSIDDKSEIESKNLNIPFGGNNNNLMNPSSTILTRVQLDAGYHTFKIDGIQGTTQFRLFNIKLDKEDLPAANTIRITDTDDNNVPSVTGGSIVCAEVALPTDVEGAKIFLVQYAGEDDEKTLVATSYILTASKLAYTAGGNNYYRTLLKTVAGAGEVKAFLWKSDGTYAPILATVSATVR